MRQYDPLQLRQHHGGTFTIVAPDICVFCSSPRSVPMILGKAYE
jgi:hypothetical protein